MHLVFAFQSAMKPKYHCSDKKKAKLAVTPIQATRLVVRNEHVHVLAFFASELFSCSSYTCRNSICFSISQQDVPNEPHSYFFFFVFFCPRQFFHDVHHCFIKFVGPRYFQWGFSSQVKFPGEVAENSSTLTYFMTIDFQNWHLLVRHACNITFGWTIVDALLLQHVLQLLRFIIAFQLGMFVLYAQSAHSSARFSHWSDVNIFNFAIRHAYNINLIMNTTKEQH